MNQQDTTATDCSLSNARRRSETHSIWAACSALVADETKAAGSGHDDDEFQIGDAFVGVTDRPLPVPVPVHRKAPIALALCLVAVAACSNSTPAKATAISATTLSTTTSTIVATTDPVTTQSTTTEPTTTTSRPFALPTVDSQQILDSFVTASGAPGAIMGISVHGGPPTILVSGVSDPKLKTPMKPDDVVFIASNTKTFVGALVLMLVGESKVSLDAPNNNYGLDFPNGDVITVGELLSHSSGIPPEGSDSGTSRDLYGNEFQAKILGDLKHFYTMADIVAYVRDRPLLFPPGSATGYSNVNTILAAQIIEKVTGQTVTQQLQDRLFTPLKLANTYYPAQEASAIPAVPFIPGLFTLTTGGALLNTADFDKTALLTAIGPAGAMASNATDMLTWGNALLRTGTVLGPDLTKQAHKIGPGGTGLGVIGFTHKGFCVFDASCPIKGAVFTGFGGSGSIPGTRSLLVYDMMTDTVIFLAANLQPLNGLDQAAIAEFELIAKSLK